MKLGFKEFIILIEAMISSIQNYNPLVRRSRDYQKIPSQIFYSLFRFNIMNDKFVKGEETEETPLGTGADLDAALRPQARFYRAGQNLGKITSNGWRQLPNVKNLEACPALRTSGLKTTVHILSPTSSNERFVLPPVQ